MGQLTHKLILPPLCKDYIDKKKVGKSNIIRTALQAPRSVMKKLVVPESLREKYTELAKDKAWTNAMMIGFIIIKPDIEFAQIQRLRAARALKRLKPGFDLAGIIKD